MSFGTPAPSEPAMRIAVALFLLCMAGWPTPHAFASPAKPDARTDRLSGLTRDDLERLEPALARGPVSLVEFADTDSDALPGIHVATIPSFAGGCTIDGATAEPPLVIPGASQPDWGPADVPPARQVNPGPGPKPSAKLAVKVRRTAGGLIVSAKVASNGKRSASVKNGRKVVGKASKSVKKGTATLKVRVKGKPRKVSVAVTFKPTAGAAITGSATAKLR